MRSVISLVFLLALGVFVYIGQNAANLSNHGIFFSLYEILDSGLEEEKEEKGKSLELDTPKACCYHFFIEFKVIHAHAYFLGRYQLVLPPLGLPPEPILV
ncbi:hypothetical protein [Algoriphagus sp.]|uniref:hypothetical protein n=1 Tax=Algoriphagus sp. TaxID=1872435 RepID=UPI00262A8783|nr:hypothetical protein [Algoriphagus sp.]